jgi:hypothetical protein
MTNKFDVVWIDDHREPRCAPDPAYPNGIDLVVAPPGVATCKTALPYPAKRCGFYRVTCLICGVDAVITTAGRPDDPRSVAMACRISGGAQ